jgi:hypothetical protein
MWARLARMTLALATALAAPVFAGFAGTDLFIPMAGRGVGAYPTNWFTTVYLYNPNVGAVAIDLTFLERNRDNVTTTPPKVTDSLAPGETRIYENIVETTFGRTGTVYGAIRIQCASRVVATARVYSKASADAPLTQSFGQDFAATPASFAIGLGEATDILGGYTTQPPQDSEARYNLGCVETTGAGSARVHWVARDGDGVERGSYDRTVPRLSQTQGFFSDYFENVSLTDARISASVVAGAGKVICYGSLVTNDRTFPKPVQDPTTFEMVYPADLLSGGTGGLVAVAHDATLAGEGTAAAPLGLADGAVTAAKVRAGQLVTSVNGIKDEVTLAAGANTTITPAGNTVTIASSGLSLPYAGSAASDTFLFKVTNTGQGVAVMGNGNTGVFGNDSGAGGYGVVGFSDSGKGVAGFSSGGVGVYAETNATTATAAVYGYAPHGHARGVWGYSPGAFGVVGQSGTSAGVYGEGEPGVQGLSYTNQGIGVQGLSTVGTGIDGWSMSGLGVHGEGSVGVSGRSTGTDAGAVTPQVGVWGVSKVGPGVQGESDQGTGVVGRSSNAKVGVWGESEGITDMWSASHGIGVQGESSDPYGSGVRGENSGGGDGVVGTSQGIGVHGYSPEYSGVYGETRGTATAGAGVQGMAWEGGGVGVKGDSLYGYGVYGHGERNVGVYGETTSTSHAAVYGYARVGAGRGVWGYSPAGYGVVGQSNTSYGVYAYSAAGYAILCDGNGAYTGSWSHVSDVRLKRNVETIADALARVTALRGVTYTWRRDEFPQLHLGDGRQVGFIAQDVELILPEVVHTGPDDLMAIDYAKLTPLLVEAIKEQQAEIAADREVIRELRARVEALEARH